MKLQAIALITSITVISLACGRPNPEDYRSQETSAATSQNNKDTKTADATKKPTTNSMTPAANTPAATPTPTPTPSATPPAAPAKAALRTAPNAAELTAMQTLYTGSCQGCHGPVGTANANAALNLKGKAATVYVAGKLKPAHNALAATFPVDTSSDDGVENEKLNASAMAQILK